MYMILLAVIYLTFISLGLPDSLLGSAWPKIYIDFNIPISYMGIVSVIISGGTVFSSLMAEKLTTKYGTRTVTVVSVFLTAIALFGFSVSKEFYQMCLWGIPYGFGAGAIDSALNNYVALNYKSKDMSWLHCFWGIGTIISPYIMSYALAHSVWNNGYRIISYLQFVIVGIIFVSFPLWKINARSSKIEEKQKVLGLKGALKIKGVPYLLFGFMAYCAAEATTMLWASSYIESIYEVTKEQAALFGSLFFIGITVGRFISGFISDKLGDNKMIIIGAFTALLGIVLLFVHIKSVAIIGLIIIGFGSAPIYPCIIHSTPQNFGADNSQGIIGIQMASAYIGSTFMPPLFGIISSVIGLKFMPIYLALFLMILLIMFFKTQKICGEK